MGVQKTGPRTGRTLAHGLFEARETVHACLARCRWPSGALVTRRAACLSEALLPGSNAGYDVMVFVGLERFVHHRQREEIGMGFPDNRPCQDDYHRQDCKNPSILRSNHHNNFNRGVENRTAECRRVESLRFITI